MTENGKSKPPAALFVIEIPLVGDADVRLITKAELNSLEAVDLQEFELWKHDGIPRFWAYTYTADQLKAHGFSMKDQHSKNHGFHESDFVGLGGGVFEYYADGFECADEIIRESGSFLCFVPDYSWGSDGCQVLRPTSDLSTLIPSCFVDLFTKKGLVALSVTSNANSFVQRYIEIDGHCGEGVGALARRLGLEGA